MKRAKHMVLGLLGGLGCAAVWALGDYLLDGHVRDLAIYSTVVFAYWAGTGPISAKL